MEQGVSQVLQVPSINAPVAALTSSSSLVLGDIADNLKPEDKKAELTLRQLQDCISPQDAWLQQDINKLLAATQFSETRPLMQSNMHQGCLPPSSHLGGCGFRSWQADAKSKWRLASSSYSGGSLFGEAFILMKNKDKCKVLPTSAKKPDQCLFPYHRWQSFRSGESEFQYQRYFHSRSDRQTDRGYNRDRPRFQQQSKRPFRGVGDCPFCRGK